MRPLADITQELGKSDAIEKSSKKDRDRLREEFFEAITETAQQGTLAQKTVSVALATEAEAREWLAKHYPLWEVIDLETVRNRAYQVVFVATLRENPTYMPWIYVNPHDHKAYRKSINQGSPILDDERLRNQNPELWERITYLPEPERVLLSSDDIDPKDLEAMQEYIYPAPPTLVFPAPREVKDTE